MPAPYESNAGKIYADGKDITERPDSIDSDEVTVVELVQTEDGEMRFLMKGEEPPPDAEVIKNELVDAVIDGLNDEIRAPTHAELEEFFSGWENEGGSLPCDGE
jgi:hypothetical protein